MTTTFDIIIVGAGPVGLLLACELGLAGVSVLVLERDIEDATWKKDFGVRGLNMRTNESFYRRGLLEVIFKEAARPRIFEKSLSTTSDGQKLPFAGHFAGMMLDPTKIDFDHWPYYIPGPWSFYGAVETIQLEQVLADRAKSLGVTVYRGKEVKNIVQDGNSVQVWTDTSECFEATYVVGCDGGRSTVRKLGAFEVEGTEPEFYGYLTLCDVDRPKELKQGFNRTTNGLYVGAGPGRWYLVDYVPFDRDEQVTQEHLEQVLQRVTLTDLKITKLHAALPFIARSAQVKNYRNDRLFLAGDSAHVHSPLGAQGLNLGIGDAMNLGWKLAAEINGTARPGLLDSYQQERHPVGAAVVAWARAQSLTLKSDLHSRAMAGIIQDLIDTQQGTTYFAARVSGMNERYDFGDAHPAVGRTVPDFLLRNGERVGTSMVRGTFVVVDLGDDSALAKAAASWSAVRYVQCVADADFGFTALLVRPDGVICWVSMTSVVIQDIEQALERWICRP